MNIVTQGRLIRQLYDAYYRGNRSNVWDVWYDPMPETKVVKFLKQFPWIRLLVSDPLEIRKVFVSGVDPGMIDREIGSGKPDGGSWSTESAFILDKGGEALLHTTEKTNTRKRYWLFGPPVVRTQLVTKSGCVPYWSTIRRTAQELGDSAEKAAFIFSFDTWTRIAIVYKRPAELGFWAWLNGEGNDDEEAVPSSEAAAQHGQ